ncbi:MAG TPA: hypothetical protein VJT32_13820 [bacterium]|nr:hypothetical protein [bacterium]
MPVADRHGPEYGSDLIVDMLRALDVGYAALNPGATFQGLLDLVNYGGGTRPGIIQYCHKNDMATTFDGRVQCSLKQRDRYEIHLPRRMKDRASAASFHLAPEPEYVHPLRLRCPSSCP